MRSTGAAVIADPDPKHLVECCIRGCANGAGSRPHPTLDATPLRRPRQGEPGNVEELWVFPDTDFAKLAQDMGGFGMRVHHPGEIQDALDKAVASGKPAAVDVVSDIHGIAPRAWTPP